MIVDRSYFRETSQESIHGDTHYALQIDHYIHKLSKHGRVELVIEYTQRDVEPHDLYFHVPESTNLNDLFIKQELSEFLSMLN
ncbi:MAG: hypothetical protein ACOVRN_07345 [Flavobacterium sp.]